MQSTVLIVEELQNQLRQKDLELMQKNRELKQKDLEIRQLKQAAQQRDKTNASLNQRLEAARALWTTDIERSNANAALLHRKEMLHDILSNERKIKKTTSFDMAQFNYIYDLFKEKCEKSDNVPLFAEDKKSSPGNRCALNKKSVLLLSLLHKKENITQDILEVLFGVNQSAISRYLKFADSILPDILPTAAKITKRIKNAETAEEFEKIVPDRTIIVDGTEVRRQRPQDKTTRDNTYSGKKKAYTFNTTIITNKVGLIIQIGKTFEGGTHDLTMIKEDKIDFGKWSDSMYNSNTPKKDRLEVLGDKGYKGMQKYYPGATVVMPAKKKKGVEFTPEQKAENKAISGRRITVEHSIGRMKRWKIIAGPYRGTKEQFEKDLMIVSGLANFHMLWDRGRNKLKLDI